MTAAVEHGLCVSKPYGDSNSYDLVVGRPGRFLAVQVKCTVFNTANGMGYICSTSSSHKQYERGRSTFWRLIWFVRMSGTSFRRKKFGASGRFLWVRSARSPGMRNIWRRGICCWGPSSMETFRLVPRNFRWAGWERLWSLGVISSRSGVLGELIRLFTTEAWSHRGNQMQKARLRSCLLFCRNLQAPQYKSLRLH